MKTRWKVEVTERRDSDRRTDWVGFVRDLKKDDRWDWKARRVNGSLITLTGFHGDTLPQPVRRAVLRTLYA